MIKSLILTIFSFIFLLLPSVSFAAACCGGAFSVPAVITSDDAGQLTSSFSQTRVEADVDPNGVWTKRTSDDITQIYRIDAAHIFWDRYQAGFSLPFETHDKAGSGTSSGLGDVSLQAGYEYLPEWDYNPWKPKGVGFLTLTLPTGKPFEEAASEDGGLSARGRGFWAGGAGTVLTKIVRAWDLSAVLEAHRSFERTWNGNQIIPGYGESLSLGAGWNSQNLRLGGAIAWNNEDPIDVRGAINSDGSAQRYTTATLSASYLFADNWAGTLSYSDQTLFGEPSTVSLNKSVALFLQKRWTR